MKAKRIFFFAMLTVAVGSMFVFAGCGDKNDENTVDADHQHNYEWTIVKDATCTEVGSRVGKCECGDEKTEEIPLAPHKLEGDITPTTDATCTSEGSGTQVCSVCHTAQPVTIPKKPHTLEHHAGVPATCKEDGQLEYWSCSVCFNNFLDDKGQNVAGSVTIPKESVDHTWNEKHVCSVCGISDPNAPHICVPTLVEEIPSTCKDHGTKKHYKCYECGKVYADAEGKTELSETDLVLELSNDHGGKQNAVFYLAVAAKDCMTYGKKARYDCKVCGRHFKTEDLDPKSEYKDITETDGEFGEDVLQTPMLNRHTRWQAHGSTSGEEPATCVKTGWTEAVIECLICGKIYKSADFTQGGDNDGIVKPKKDADGNEIEGTVSDPVDRNTVEIPIDPNHHESLQAREQSESNGCGRNGAGYNMACYECTACGKFFADEDATQSLTKDEVLSFAAHTQLDYVEATASTCTVAGHPAHWECKSCGEWFNTGDPGPSTDPMSESERDLDLIPHDFSDYGKNSKGHWPICAVCGEADVDEDGNPKMENHDMGDGEDENCYICGYKTVEYVELFETKVKGKGEKAHAVIEGLFKAPGETQYAVSKFVASGETTLRIPEFDKEGNPITVIEDGALSTSDHIEYGNVFNGILEVVIPNSVTKIGDNAFYGFVDRMPSFKTITFESGASTVEIGENAFRNLTNLETLILPEKMTTIPAGLVYNCKALTKIQMPKQVTDTSEGITLTNVFYECNKLEMIDLWCLENMTFSFGNMCFYNCNELKTIYIPKGLNDLGSYSFGGCTKVEHIYFGDTESEWTALLNRNKSTYADYPWNYNNATLADGNLNGIVTYSYTHTGNEN